MGQLVTRESLLGARGGAKWAGAIREASLDAFNEQGIPTRRSESWKYSDLAQALKDKSPSSPAASEPPEFAGANVVAYRDGVLDTPSCDFPANGFTLLSDVLADETSPYADLIGAINPQQRHPVVCLNTADMEDGFVLHVPKGVHVFTPLHVRFDWRAHAEPSERGRHVRLIVVLDEGAEATLIESHVGAPHFATVVTETRLAPGARLDHVRLERLGETGCLSAATIGEIDAGARYQGFYLSEGARFARHEALLKLTGEKAEAVLDGALLAAGATHADNTIVIAHDAPDTSSRQTFRNVLGGKAQGVFQGCVKVSRAAQKTDAKQMCRSLLLSRKARISAKPELEIFADDVKCAHGAASGDLDEQALFFLRSRGIPLAEARIMLVEAFLADGVDAIGNEAVREATRGLITDWIARHGREVFENA